MSTEITYKGNVIASIESGQKATIKCQGKDMEEDIVVSETGVEVNGTVNGKVVEEQVASGKSVKMGDFVETVNGGDAFRIDSGGSNYSFFAHFIDDHTIFYVYGYSSEVSGTPLAEVVGGILKFVDNEGWSVSHTKTLCSKTAGYSLAISSVSTCSLSSNKFIVSCSFDYQASQYGADKEDMRVFVVEVNDDLSISPHTESGLLYELSSNYNTTEADVKVHKIDNAGFVFLRNTRISDKYSSYLHIFTVNSDNTLSERFTRTYSGERTSVAVVNSGELLWSKLKKTDDVWETLLDRYYISSYALIKNGDSISIPDPVEHTSEPFYNLYRISEEYYILCNTYYRYDGSSFYVVESEHTPPGFNSAYYPFAPLSGESYMYAALSYIFFRNLSTGLSFSATTSYPDPYVLASSSESILVFFPKEGLCVPYRITENSIEPDLGSTKSVQPATDSRFMYGVALENGDSGETIKIAIPNIKENS